MFTQQLEQLTQIKQAMLQHAKGLTETQLHYKPAPNKWSTAEILYHVMLAEKGTLAYVKKKLHYGNIPPVPWTAAWQMLLLRIVYYLPLKFKAPAAVAVFPNDITLEKIQTDWADTRSDLKVVLQNMDAATAALGIYKHPIVGRLNAAQMLDFLLFHCQTHRKQIQHLHK